MLKKFIIAMCALFAAVNFAFAGVEVNTADRAALETVKEIGPKTAEAIIAERGHGGKFKDWDDLVKRVKGIGPANVLKMSEGGLTVNGQTQAHAPVSANAKAKVTDAMPVAKPTATAKGKETSSAMPAAAPAAAPSTHAPIAASTMSQRNPAKPKQGAGAPASN